MKSIRALYLEAYATKKKFINIPQFAGKKIVFFTLLLHKNNSNKLIFSEVVQRVILDKISYSRHILHFLN